MPLSSSYVMQAVRVTHLLQQPWKCRSLKKKTIPHQHQIQAPHMRLGDKRESFLGPYRLCLLGRVLVEDAMFFLFTVYLLTCSLVTSLYLALSVGRRWWCLPPPDRGITLLACFYGIDTFGGAARSQRRISVLRFLFWGGRRKTGDNLAKTKPSFKHF